MIEAFGPPAQRYAEGLGDLDAIVAGRGNLHAAVIEAMRRRHLGELFYGMLLLDDPHDSAVTALAPAVVAQTEDDDLRRRLLNNVNPAESGLTPHDARAAYEFLNLCPALLVRSSLEYERISNILSRRRPFEIVVLEPQLPDVERRLPERPAVVIWAPERDVGTATFHVFALAELHGATTLVSADGLVPPGASCRALRYGDPRVGAALATAAGVVVTDATDPGAAIAFARRGYGVVAPVSAGAHEFVRGAQVYDPALQRDLFVATLKSLAEPASLRALPPMPPRVPALPALPHAFAAAPPPVTVVIPTFNRRDDIERALSCVGAQTYPNVRAVVVNDAGTPVDDIVARFPFARLLNLERNGGAIHAAMAGLDVVTDGFVQFLADDDWLFPDHVQRLATTMIRSGALIAHANAVIRYVTRLDDGSFETTGFNAGVFNDTATPTEALIATSIAGNALMWRRSVFSEIGGWREDCGLADQEIQLRAGQRFAFVYVDQVTAEWRVHASNFSKTADSIGEQRRVYEELHPVEGRPLVTATRENTLAGIAARPAGFIFEATVRVMPTRKR